VRSSPVRSRHPSRPAGAQATRAPTRRRARRLAAASLAVALLGLAACGSQTRTLRTGALARAIVASIQKLDGIATTVSCPDHPPERTGYRFVCTAHLAVGAYAVAVIERNAGGMVSYAGVAPLRALDSAGIERAIERVMRGRRRRVTSVHCPSPVLQLSGLAFRCTARTRSGADVVFRVHEINGRGRVTLTGA
jgi:hypothetical protein